MTSADTQHLACFHPSSWKLDTTQRQPPDIQESRFRETRGTGSRCSENSSSRFVPRPVSPRAKSHPGWADSIGHPRMEGGGTRPNARHFREARHRCGIRTRRRRRAGLVGESVDRQALWRRSFGPPIAQLRRSGRLVWAVVSSRESGRVFRPDPVVDDGTRSVAARSKSRSSTELLRSPSVRKLSAPTGPASTAPANTARWPTRAGDHAGSTLPEPTTERTTTTGATPEREYRASTALTLTSAESCHEASATEPEVVGVDERVRHPHGHEPVPASRVGSTLRQPTGRLLGDAPANRVPL